MNDINERMAKVMGWHRGKDKNKEYSDRYYSKEGGNPIIWASDSNMPRTWHPDTSIEQVMMCAEKLKPDTIDISCPTTEIGNGSYVVRMFFWREAMYEGKAETVELAICNAILEAMDGDNIIPLNLDMEDKDE